jgi:hypothetical protein
MGVNVDWKEDKVYLSDDVVEMGEMYLGLSWLPSVGEQFTANGFRHRDEWVVKSGDDAEV